ncbi:MAG: phosphatase PAP2 family protein [Planctomycetes bacterium]|nr:phosphatase PAP2 family protein [Planctomycetota bacterium]
MVSLASLYRWDAATCHRINAINRQRPFDRIFALASRLGDGAFWYGMMALMPVLYGLDGLAQSIVLALNGVLCTATYRWIKQSTSRPRPSAVYETLTLTVAPLDRFSFPSGHTLHAVSFTILICQAHPLLMWLLVPFTALVAMSRMVLGLHYPSDVLAGAAIGTMWALAAIAIAPWLVIP